MWTGAQVVRVECEDIEPPQYCKAVVRIDFKAPQFGYSLPTLSKTGGIGGDCFYIKIYLINALTTE